MKEISNIRGGSFDNGYLSKLLDIINKQGFVAGSFATYICSPNKNPSEPNDIDIWSYQKESNLPKILDNLFPKIKENDRTIEYLWDLGLKQYRISFIIPREEQPIDGKIGYIKTYGDPYDVISRFDITVGCAAIISSRKSLVHDQFEDHEKKKLIKINNVVCPLATTRRIVKYIKKGYRCPLSTWIQIFEKFNNLPDKKDLIALVEKSEAGIDDPELIKRLYLD